jgi:hypothetical protein
MASSETSTTRPKPASAFFYRSFCFVIFFVAAAASFNGFYDKWHFREEGVPGGQNAHLYGFEKIVDGTASRPFAYRQLVPTMANWIDRMTPSSLKMSLYNHQGNSQSPYFIALFDSPMARNQVYFFRYFVVYAVTFAFVLLAVYAMYLVCAAAGLSPPAAVFAPVVVILLIPYFLSIGGYFYDYPELAFMALAVWVALKFDWWWLIPVAALGTWNKESFLLFVLTLYPILRGRNSRPKAMISTGVLCLVCAAVYYPIRVHFAHNPGGTVYVEWQKHLRFFEHPLNLLIKSETTYGLYGFRIFTIVPLALLAWMAWRGWRLLPSAIRRHGQLAAAINVPLYFLFCAPGELRDLSLLYMVFLLLAGANLDEWIGRSVRAGVVQTSS